MLTKQNYHSREMNQKYMSVSQYKSFMKCEAATKAELDGRYAREQSSALLVGSFVHAGIEGTLDKFKEDHPEIFTKQGKLRAEFIDAEEMIKTVMDDEFVKMLFEGSVHEHIVAGNIGGVEWKGMIDAWNKEKNRVIEVKTTKSIRDFNWSKEHGGRVSFVEEYNYLMQAAVYGALIAQQKNVIEYPESIMIAISKQSPHPDKELIGLNDKARWDHELGEIQKNLPYIMQVKNGEITPKRCESCEYCRSTKKLSKIVHYSELIPA